MSNSASTPSAPPQLESPNTSPRSGGVSQANPKPKATSPHSTGQPSPFGPPASEGPPAYERLAQSTEGIAVSVPPSSVLRRVVVSVPDTGPVAPHSQSVVSLPGPYISRPGPSVSRPVSLPATIGPPVPKRKDSLPSSQSNKRSHLSSLTSARGDYHSSRGTRCSSFHGPLEPLDKEKSYRKVVAEVQTMSNVETMLDEPHSTSTFEARNLCRDSFAALQEFFENKQLCDVEVKVGKKKIPCHRLVLACASRYFKTMFTSEMTESRSTEVTIQDIDENSLEQLIAFAYTAKITITTENVQSLLYASSILQIETVAIACCDFMKTHLHPTNCIGVRNFAEIHGRSELMKMADSFARDHFMNIVECEEYLSISPHHLEILVESDDLNVDNETMVFEAVMKWVKHDLENNKQHLPRLLAKVKLPLLPATYLVEKVGFLAIQFILTQ